MTHTSKLTDFTPYNPLYHSAIELIGRKWSGAIIRVLLTGSTQFSDFGHIIPGVSDRLVSVRLKELEQAGIVQRLVIPDKPVRIEYRLTTKGESLGDIVERISSWAEAWAADAQSAATNDTD